MNGDATTTCTANDEPIPLRLIDIARWQIPDLAENTNGSKQKPAILPGLPSLQRGAVWKPNQIELLWDSVLRGFPIGSMVVCKRLQHQSTRSGTIAGGNDQQRKTTLPWAEEDYTHHLLDGQQRANALALGYLDPFPDSLPGRDPDTLLWLDLQPDQPGLSRIPSQSSRSFLLRVTTVAHPWGFKVSDAKEPVRLEHAHAKEAKDKFDQLRQEPCATRPRPRYGWPFEANVPIPMAWALEAARVSGKSGHELYKHLQTRCVSFLKNHSQHNYSAPDDPPRLRPWASRAKDLLESRINAPDTVPTQARYLAQALMRAASARTVAFAVPDDVLSQPGWTEDSLATSVANADEQDISNVEHLFQRLNSGGTILDGDELRYSMIKAYWPGIESTIQTINPRPPETQVALLGARLALDSDDGKLPAAPTVEALRRLGNIDTLKSLPQKKEESHRVQGRRKARKCIEDAFGLGPSTNTVGIDASPIARSFKTLDTWFLHDPANQTWGLPKVLRSRLAEQAPEVFLFLLRLVRFHLEHVAPDELPDEHTRRKLLGLATAIHWFGKDRPAAMRWLWETKEPAQWLDGSAFDLKPLTALQALPGKDASNSIQPLPPICTPTELNDFIDKNTFNHRIEDWKRWQTLIVAPAKEMLDPDADRDTRDATMNARRAKYAVFMDVLSQRGYKGSNALLLMYAQREQMAKLFGDYDPSHVGYWDSHNVPWDFDHILPQKAFYNRKQRNTYVAVCKEWGETIANLHVWPFELNRSRHDKKAEKSLPGGTNELRRMLLWDNKDCRPFFSLTGYHVEDSWQDQAESRQKVTDFVCNARSRMLRIYSDWFKELFIGELL